MTPKQLFDTRKALGMTQQEMADALDVTRLTVANWEKAKYHMPEDKRAIVLNMTVAPKQIAEKELKGDRYYTKLSGNLGLIRTLNHPFWYLGVGSPYREKMEAEGKTWREPATTKDLEGYTTPTPDQAYQQLLAAGCNDRKSYWYITSRLRYPLPFPMPALPNSDEAFNRAHNAWLLEHGTLAGFWEAHPQHHDKKETHEPQTSEEIKKGLQLQKELDDAFTFNKGDTNG